jgi:hypothetical protein
LHLLQLTICGVQPSNIPKVSDIRTIAPTEMTEADDPIISQVNVKKFSAARVRFLGTTSIQLNCPDRSKVINTMVKLHPSSHAWIMSVIRIFVRGFLFPFFIKAYYDHIHCCPDCGERLYLDLLIYESIRFEASCIDLELYGRYICISKCNYSLLLNLNYE